MKIRDIILETDETLAAQLRDELTSKVGNPVLPQFQQLPQDAVLARAMNYAVRPNYTVDLSVDQAIKDIMATKQDAQSQPAATKINDKEYDFKQDSKGRTLRHKRYYTDKDTSVTKNVRAKAAGAKNKVTRAVRTGSDLADKLL